MFRVVIAIVLAIVVGIIALPWIFSDLGPEESMIQRITILGSLFFIGGAFVRSIAGRKWRVSALCAWSPVAMGLTGLVGNLPVMEKTQLRFWIELGTFLLAPLGVALGGYVGSLLQKVAGKNCNE